MSNQPGFGNIAVNLGGTNNILNSLGSQNSTLNIGGTGNQVLAFGVANNATQVGGTNNVVQANNANFTNQKFGGNVALSLFCNGNLVTSGQGPLAVAGAIGKSGLPVNQSTTGVNINNI